MDGISPTMIIISAAVCCGIAGYIGTLKGYPFSHLGAAGLFLGPIGVVIAVLARRKEPAANKAATSSQGRQPPLSTE